MPKMWKLQTVNPTLIAFFPTMYEFVPSH